MEGKTYGQIAREGYDESHAVSTDGAWEDAASAVIAAYQSDARPTDDHALLGAAAVLYNKANPADIANGTYTKPMGIEDAVIVARAMLAAIRATGGTTGGEPVEHGVTCTKAPHTGSGYLHGSTDDTPYNVDGCAYCGRCHMAL